MYVDVFDVTQCTCLNTTKLKLLNLLFQSRYCQVVGLQDLDQKNPYVRKKQTEYLNKLLEIGVAGFRYSTDTQLQEYAK